MESFATASLIEETYFLFLLSECQTSQVIYHLVKFILPIGAESLRIARASNNPKLFSTAIKPLIACMSKQEISIEKN